MWIRINDKQDDCVLSHGRLVITIYTVKSKPWHATFNKWFARVDRIVEIMIWSKEELS